MFLFGKGVASSRELSSSSKQTAYSKSDQSQQVGGFDTLPSRQFFPMPGLTTVALVRRQKDLSTQNCLVT
jgi:hypothetical protein